jgi:hypothetical protein
MCDNLEIIIQSKGKTNKKVKYVFRNPDLFYDFDNLINAKMIELEGKKKLRLRDAIKIKG